MKEKLAKLCHEQWSGWMEYLFSKCFKDTGQFDKTNGNLVIPKWAVERWKRQMETPYSELSDKEQDSDRNEADKFLVIFNKKGSQRNELF